MRFEPVSREMGSRLYIAGDKFGKLVALERLPSILDADGKKRSVWKCKCECGNVVEVRLINLRSGISRSCGCLKRNEARIRLTTHGMRKTRVYSIWQSMVSRCNNPNTDSYPDYGGRGIKVCDAWLKFENFRADMGDPPEGMSIDRYPNNNGNYEQGNCRWATLNEQAGNRRDSIVVEMDGVSKCLLHWCGRSRKIYSWARRKIANGEEISQVVKQAIEKIGQSAA